MTIRVTHPVTESDLLAYVDNRLGKARRAEIDAHLARCPQDAARVAADLALLAGLRLLHGRPAAGLSRPLRRKAWRPGRAAWAALLAACGFMAGLGASAAGLPFLIR